ncbi:hypothetical protein MJN59_25400, partial [Salmonella enterica subsp. enterica serovar Anatum]|nr:hypothetical protein [Salmonella enterica subsp. enterica serovar Anatum]
QAISARSVERMLTILAIPSNNDDVTRSPSENAPVCVVIMIFKLSGSESNSQKMNQSRMNIRRIDQ